MDARAAVAIVFAINGLLYGAWAARLPAVSDRLDLSAGELGLALGFIAAGSLVAMPLAGRAAGRYGSRPATRVAALAFCAASAAAPAAPGLALLCLACFALGAAAGSLDIVMNAHGVAVEREAGRPILSSFHAAFSLGGLVGALAGAAGAAAGVDVRIQLAALGAVAAVVAAAVTRRLLPAAADAAGPRVPGAGVRLLGDSRLLVLGVLAFACLLCEGAAADWSAVYLDRDLAAGKATAGLAFAGFSVAMVAGRLVGDSLTVRFGSAALVRGGALIATAGMAAALIADDATVGLAGFTCLGAGLSVVIPQVFRAAADGRDSGPALARVATIGYLGFLAGPPAIGGLAELTSLPAALAVVPLLGVVIALLAPATGAVRPAR